MEELEKQITLDKIAFDTLTTKYQKLMISACEGTVNDFNSSLFTTFVSSCSCMF
jgi:hypothetical protein